MRLRKGLEPRQWQKAALSRWAENLSGIAHVVTGGGKTIFSYLCIEEFLKQFPNGRVNIVVPTLALMDQWALDIAESMEFQQEEIACFSGEDKANQPAKINVTVMNTARNLGEWLASDEETFLIVDECHRSATKENSRSLAGTHSATLGLSATPYRENDDGFDSYLVPSLGNVIFEYSYRDAHRDKVIVDFDLVNIDISVTDDVFYKSNLSRKSMIALESDETKKSQVRSAKTFANASRTAWAVRLAIAHRDQRIIIFHERVGSLHSICSGLKSQGMTSVAYHSRMSSAHRRDNLRMFRRGESNVLVTCRALDEGTNVPESNVAIVAQSTTSTRQRIQRLGRVLRPANGKNYATVYTLYYGEDRELQLREEEAGLIGVAETTWKAAAIK